MPPRKKTSRQNTRSQAAVPQQQTASSPEKSRSSMSRQQKAVIASSLDSIQIQPRTPRTARYPREDDDVVNDTNEVELSLLNEHERRNGVQDDGFGGLEGVAASGKIKRRVSDEDRRSIVLLCILCAFPTMYDISVQPADMQGCSCRPHSGSSGTQYILLRSTFATLLTCICAFAARPCTWLDPVPSP
jgi:hypothetical protein